MICVHQRGSPSHARARRRVGPSDAAGRQPIDTGRVDADGFVQQLSRFNSRTNPAAAEVTKERRFEDVLPVSPSCAHDPPSHLARTNAPLAIGAKQDCASRATRLTSSHSRATRQLWRCLWPCSRARSPSSGRNGVDPDAGWTGYVTGRETRAWFATSAGTATACGPPRSGPSMYGRRSSARWWSVSSWRRFAISWSRALQSAADMRLRL